jgi:folylpolyglutamate synthase/dihydrofolate synthase
LGQQRTLTTLVLRLALEEMTMINLSLDRISHILKLLDEPHRDQSIIHVAGTNGKGSTIAVMAAILIAAGYKTGQFNSPYFLDPSDSILINGKPSLLYADIYHKVSELSKTQNLNCTPFEIETATAMMIFKMERVDIVLLEVGLGGRLDATNVIDPPKLAVITNISMDHMEYLGNSIQDIAREKCGILKQGTDSVIVSDQEFHQVYDVVDSFSELKGCKSYKVDLKSVTLLEQNNIEVDYFSKRLVLPMKLRGRHQINNACTALLALSRLERIDLKFKFSSQSIKSGMENVYWPGRLEKYSYKNYDILIDGAHNVSGAKHLKDYLKGCKNLTWILGFSQSKDVEGILDILLENGDTVIAMGFESPANMPWVKCMDPGTISSIISRKRLKINNLIASNFDDAFEKINQNSITVVCGSLYLVSQLCRTIKYN